ncbi:MAG: winged helix-turn-helix transcriptional regulator [Candidatus Bathyarchaeota archaeon]|nr:MAG: winged helix-turn-helix transcriptional regulator [Candidatus Bathyarchaeota archaeon]
MANIKDINYAILSRLTKNARTSDRQLAREIGVSQPTITRRRARLEKEGFLTYKTVPNFKKLGLEIMAFTLVAWKREAHQQLLDAEDYDSRIQGFFKKHPNIVFASSGQGVGMTRIAISVHKNYSDYVKFINSVDETWGTYLDRHDSFIVSFKSDTILKQLAFENIIEYLHTIDAE